MFFSRIGRRAFGVLLAAGLWLPVFAAAEASQPDGRDFSAAPYVFVSLQQVNDEQGVRLIDGQPDGLSEAGEDGGRRALPNTVGSSRYLYFDVHDSYIHGGFNQVVMTIIYDDVGLTPIDLEYDAYDVVRPGNTAPEWVMKRVNVAVRTNTGAVRTARVVLDDARFANRQPGGADFRLVAQDEMLIRYVSLMRTYGPPENLPVRVVVDSEEVTFDVPPYIDPVTGRTLVPVRRLLNALGVADDDILFSDVSRTVTARKGDTMIVLQIDSDRAGVYEQGVFREVTLDQPAVVKDGRTLIPLRFVSENLGLKVKWDPQMRLITIASPSEQELSGIDL